MTFPLRTSTDKATLLSAVDGDVAAVMLARLAVVRARTVGNGDPAVHFLCVCLRRPVVGGGDGLTRPCGMHVRDTRVAQLLRAAGQPQQTLPFFRLPLSLQDLPMRSAGSVWALRDRAFG
jgi:hypothetical protein